MTKPKDEGERDKAAAEKTSGSGERRPMSERAGTRTADLRSGDIGTKTTGAKERKTED